MRLLVSLAVLLISATAAAADPVDDCNRLAANPNDPGHAGAGVAFDDVDSAAAIAACLPAVDAHPNDGRLVYQLGRAYDVGGDFDAAENAYLRANDLGFALAKRNLGYLYAEGSKPDPKEAERWWRAAAKDGDSEAMNSLAWQFVVDGRNLKEAESFARNAVKLAPEDDEYLDTLGWIYFKRGKEEEAAAELEHAVRVREDDASFHAHLGWVYDALGRAEDAKKEFKRALQLPVPTTLEDATFDKAAIEKKLAEM